MIGIPDINCSWTLWSQWSGRKGALKQEAREISFRLEQKRRRGRRTMILVLFSFSLLIKWGCKCSFHANSVSAGINYFDTGEKAYHQQADLFSIASPSQTQTQTCSLVLLLFCFCSLFSLKASLTFTIISRLLHQFRERKEWSMYPSKMQAVFGKVKNFRTTLFLQCHLETAYLRTRWRWASTLTFSEKERFF